MKKFLVLIVLLPVLSGYSQGKEYFKNTIGYAHLDYIQTEHYNAPKLNPIRETSGFVIGISHDLIATPVFHLDVKLGYRYINEYAHPQAATFFNSTPFADSTSYDYHGGWTGVGFNLGRRHLWETSLIVGGGLAKKPRLPYSFGELELGLQTGYKYIAKNGFVVRAGIMGNFSRNTFFSTMYSGYLGIGYAIQQSLGFANPDNKEKGKPYFNINASGYIGSITLDAIGANLRIDHFLFNGQYADLGYGLSGRVAMDFDGQISYSASASLIGLFGQKPSKFELSIGPNFPFEEISSNFLTWYEAVHLGMGYRLVPEGIPLTFRVGTATTSIVHAGIGFRF